MRKCEFLFSRRTIDDVTHVVKSTETSRFVSFLGGFTKKIDLSDSLLGNQLQGKFLHISVHERSEHESLHPLGDGWRVGGGVEAVLLSVLGEGSGSLGSLNAWES